MRRRAGIFDGSPLGKLEVYGPDAAEFLDLMYVGTMSTLALGQARYGVVLNENGIVADDGIVARLGEQHYWVNTTSAGVERTAAAFEEWLQCEYTHLKVLITPVTSRWGNVTVAGPRAWEWLSAAGFDPRFAPSSMPHMTLRAGTLDGVPLRILRASFSGELGYEINLPADQVGQLLRRLWARAADFEAVPYGIEALEVMRTEKCFIHIGTDTDGTTSARRYRIRARRSIASGRISSDGAPCRGRLRVIRRVFNWWRYRRPMAARGFRSVPRLPRLRRPRSPKATLPRAI